ncbi:MAG: hypothetical protein ACO231_01855, partial [Prochlorococcaceae cyanobacterium]
MALHLGQHNKKINLGADRTDAAFSTFTAFTTFIVGGNGEVLMLCQSFRHQAQAAAGQSCCDAQAQKQL